MIDHVTANVSDFERAKAFYEQALAPLGYSLQMALDGAAGFGTGEGTVPDFWIGSRSERGASHVAFAANNRASVDAFYEAAIAAGGTDNGAPGLRPYHDSYYAAYVHDADGNNIEAVCHRPE